MNASAPSLDLARLLADTEQLLAGRARPAGQVWPDVPGSSAGVSAGVSAVSLEAPQECAVCGAEKACEASASTSTSTSSSIRIPKAVAAAD